MEVTNRFKGLYSDRLPEELWTEVRDIVQEAGIETHPQEKEMQKGKMVVWGIHIQNIAYSKAETLLCPLRSV